MLREYQLYPWHFGGPDEMYPSEADAVTRDMREVREAHEKAHAAASKGKRRG